ncbi:FadR/GntR family transcriptional regulator [Acinetobacter sp. MD2(2019)]|uniref:FadR/GntR family transcriptional regulator n=1 Tax=Acinetobacter sp. MD2(2019) TaxID=2605273 RepID=UPI002D1EE898|nr:GntR family transcriptional regulator [Acinetobacter sp. MD2(2019)]MEB3754503.1 FadR family transcriptional regulator [Acinetobacter sp. MD2(2019)]
MITHAVIFAPLGQATRSEQVVERLSNAIVTGLLEAHEQLPNEAELSKLMGVSHITIREALNTLRAKELIYTTRGRNGGSFICEIPAKKLVEHHPLHHMSSDYLADLGELHTAIIGHSAKLAAERSTIKDLSKLKEFIDTFEQAPNAELKAQADMRCLLTLTATAQSPRLASHELAIQAEWASLIAMLYKNTTMHAEVVEFYRELLLALHGSDGAAAMFHAQAMIVRLTDHLIAMKFTLDE